MEKTQLERQGRVLIPKKIRERLSLRSGEQMSINIEGSKIVLKPLKEKSKISSELKGCVKGSRINPLELKKIWEM